MPRYEKDDLSLSPYYRLTKKEAKQRYDEMYSLIKDLAPNFEASCISVGREDLVLGVLRCE